MASVDIWRRATVNDIVQTGQPVAAKVCIETYPNFKKLTLSKDGTSHFLYLHNSAYYDPSFTSASDEEDPMVIINLDISNSFDFETVVHELTTRRLGHFPTHPPPNLVVFCAYQKELLSMLQRC